MARRLSLLLLLLPFLFAAAPAQAAKPQIQRRQEVVSLVFPKQHGFDVVAMLYPDRGVAVLYTTTGKGLGRRRERWAGVVYAVHAPRWRLRDGIEFVLGGLGEMRGRLVTQGPTRHGHHDPACRGPQPVSEDGHFVGRLRFEGAGGYLSVTASRARAYVTRTARLRCRHGHAESVKKAIPGLFGYLEAPLSLSGHDGTFLTSDLRTRRRIVRFLAVRQLEEPTATFTAASLEWLPGEVGATRWIRVSRVRASAFTTAQPELHPPSARVEPPAPFAGSATYGRRTQSLRGNLSVSMPGLRVRIGDRRSQAGVCAATLRHPRWVCR